MTGRRGGLRCRLYPYVRPRTDKVSLQGHRGLVRPPPRTPSYLLKTLISFELTHASGIVPGAGIGAAEGRLDDVRSPPRIEAILGLCDKE